MARLTYLPCSIAGFRPKYLFFQIECKENVTILQIAFLNLVLLSVKGYHLLHHHPQSFTINMF